MPLALYKATKLGRSKPDMYTKGMDNLAHIQILSNTVYIMDRITKLTSTSVLEHFKQKWSLFIIEASLLHM